jgi:hypothetical protein
MKFGFVFLLILFFSCTVPSDKLGMKMPVSDCIEHTFFKDPSADFAAHSIGESRNVFLERRICDPLYESGMEVIDSVGMCRNENCYTEITYRFYNNHLTDMEVTFFFGKKGDSDADLPTYLEVIRRQLSARYGASARDNGIYSWLVDNEQKTMEVYLSNESAGYGRPVIRLLYYSAGISEA